MKLAKVRTELVRRPEHRPRPRRRPRRRSRRPCRSWPSVGLEELRGDLQEAELTIDGLAAKSPRQERLIAHLERFNAQVLEENKELRRLLTTGAVEA